MSRWTTLDLEAGIHYVALVSNGTTGRYEVTVGEPGPEDLENGLAE